MTNKIKVIGFDADDTLWENEPYYRETEAKFCELLKDYMPEEELTKELFDTEIKNLELYGYGIKAFTLSLVETAIRISNERVSTSTIKTIIELGKEQLNKPNHLLDGVSDVLEALKGKYKLIVATKGDLLDQEKKLKNSNLLKYFHHIEIMSDKQMDNYKDLIKHLDIEPHELMMVGNSLKSDIVPILELGGYGVYIPFHVTWQHEYHDESGIINNRFFKISSISELLNLPIIKLNN